MKNILFALLLFLIQNVFASGIKDLIMPFNLTAGRTDTVLISDVFYSDNYKLSVTSNNDIRAEYTRDKHLILTPSEKFSGMGLIEFRKEGKNYEIPYYTGTNVMQTFIYKTKGKVNQVNLFGSFNGWNRQELVMSDKNSPGTYKISIPIEPGRYEYKFFVDGQEITDHSNSDSVSNGMGAYNSIIVVKPLNPENIFLHILGSENNIGNTTLIFYFQKENETPLQKSSVIALINNSKLPDNQLTIEGFKIKVTLTKDDLKNDPVVRIAVNENGLTTNLQTVRFVKGEFAANQKKQSNYDNIIYALLIDRFDDGDKSNSLPVNDPRLAKQANYEGGDLQGVVDKLNSGYFDSLGINMIWLSPVVDNTDIAYQEYLPPHRFYSGYHGYWPVSSTKVEERFGDMNLLKKLVKIAHQHNIKVILDYVANHVLIEHPLWKQHRDWFGQLYLPDGTRNLRRWDDYRLTTWFEPFMPKFDYIHSKAALEYMTNNAVWWIKTTGIDGFRHDAVKHVPNVYWRLLTKKLKKEFQNKNRLLYQIGETFGSYELVSSYVNNGQLDAQFNFLLYDTAIPTFSSTVSFKALDEQMKKTFQVYGYNHLMGNIMDSNDKVRFMAYADGEVTDTTKDANALGWENPPMVRWESSHEKLKLYLAYLNTIPGIPIIDYGDEIGMTGAGDPDNRRMMRFGADLAPWEKQTLTDVREIINLRKNHPALRYGDFLTLKADDKNYVYLRSDMNEHVLVALNKSGNKTSFDIQLPDFYHIKRAVNLVTNEEIKIVNNILPLSLNDLSWGIYKLD
jgi:glycosidase